MRTKSVFCQAVVWSAALGMIVPAMPASVRADSTNPSIRDVALTTDGAFHGRFIGTDGQPVSAAVVVVRANGEAVAQTVTGNHGEFEVVGLQPGTYEVTAGDTTETIRVWSRAAAPPTAANGATLSQSVVRAQGGYCCDPTCMILGLTGIALGTAALIEVHNLSNRVDGRLSP